MAQKNNQHRAFHIIALLTASLSFSGCGLIFGTDQTVDTKSRDYSVLRLDKLNDGKWKAIESKASPDSGDIAYESPSTGAIISLNSICKVEEKSSLRELSKSLLMGLKKKNDAETREYNINGLPAFESTVNAETIDGRDIRIRTVVLKKQRCTYDIMYLAPQNYFQTQLSVFDKFLKGFHVE